MIAHSCFYSQRMCDVLIRKQSVAWLYIYNALVWFFTLLLLFIGNYCVSAYAQGERRAG